MRKHYLDTEIDLAQALFRLRNRFDAKDLKCADQFLHTIKKHIKSHCEQHHKTHNANHPNRQHICSNQMAHHK